MTDKSLFLLTQSSAWLTAGIDTQYKLVNDGNGVILVFQPSSSRQDWLDNLACTPYRGAGWYAHRGFVRAWRLAEPQITHEIVKGNPDHIQIVGYSHGGALAVLAHEWFDFNGYNVDTVAFGCPRVLWMPKYEILGRFKRIRILNNRGDIVGMVPPSLLGYRHPVTVSGVGKWSLPSHKPHYPSAYVENLC
jgi:predicted lipase